MKDLNSSNGTGGLKTLAHPEGIETSSTDPERKAPAEGLRKQREILQIIFDRSPLMISLIDSNFQVQAVNREWERKMGWSLEELKDPEVDILSEFYPDPEDRERTKQFIRKPPGGWVDFKIRTRDGRSLDTIWTRIQLSDGSSIGIGKDVTADRHAEQARREAEEKYHDIFEN